MRYAIAAVVLFFLNLFAIPVLMACALFGARDAFLAYGRWMMRVGRFILGIDVDVAGIDRLDRKTPYVFMSNHVSFLDGPALMTVIDRPARVIVKRFVFRVPVLGLGMLFAGYVPLDKEGAGSGRISIARAARLIKKKGYSFLIYPEGQRSWDGKLQPFRRGGFFLALQAGTPIVPVSVKGTYDLMPRGKWLIKKGPVRIVFHEPIAVSGYSQETMPELMERVRAAVSSALAS